MPTEAHLDFQLAHAQTRDAMHLQLDTNELAEQLQQLGYSALVMLIGELPPSVRRTA